MLITEEEEVDPKTAQGILRHASSDINEYLHTRAEQGKKHRICRGLALQDVDEGHDHETEEW
jgi:hypothetical protein